MDRAELAETAAVLRAVVDSATQAEDVTVDPIESAYLRGAADALEQVADQRPDFLKGRRGPWDGERSASAQDGESQ